MAATDDGAKTFQQCSIGVFDTWMPRCSPEPPPLIEQRPLRPIFSREINALSQLIRRS